MDGTLADSIDLYYELACEILDAAGAPRASREDVCRLMGAGDPAMLRKIFPPGFKNLERTIKHVVGLRYHRWMQRFTDEIQPIVGIEELLRGLHSRGILLGVATSAGRDLPYLDRWGFRDIFSAVVGREDVSSHKPDPEPVLLCLERLGLEADQVLYVGDSPVDIQAGRAAAVTTLGVLTGTSDRATLEAHAPDFLLESAADLYRILPAVP